MTKCIYREVTLNHNKPEDSDTASLEHIILWAIGGSNGFATDDASKAANNDLGSGVDAKFADTLPIAIKRFKFQIKSQKGNVPSIIWKAVTPDGDKATFTVNPDWSTEVKIGTVVDRPAPGQAGPMTASGLRPQGAAGANPQRPAQRHEKEGPKGLHARRPPARVGGGSVERLGTENRRGAED